MSNEYSALYWRPQKTSRKMLVVIAVGAMVGLAIVEFCGASNEQTVAVQLAAARRADQYMEVIKQRRIELGHKFDTRFDPLSTGLIGVADSSITSKTANLSAKQISVHPDFAAAIVDMLLDAGVKQGDAIAIGWTGSFPALNTCLCAAIETLELKPIAIASAMSSQYGANMADFLWIDMEKTLADKELINFRSSAMTCGGAADRAYGASNDAQKYVQAAQERNGISWLTTHRLRQSIDERMAVYARENQDGHFAAYVNVGGGVASMGGEESYEAMKAGLSLNKFGDSMPDCVATRFASAGVPVIHLAQARKLAKEFHVNVDETQHHVAGESELYVRSKPSRALAALVLAAILGTLYAFVLRDHGYRFLDLLASRMTRKAKPAFHVVGDSENVISQLMV